MKLKTMSGITEELDFERLANELERHAIERQYYFTNGDLNCLIQDIQNELYNCKGCNGEISYYELRYIIRMILERSKFKWLSEGILMA